jgi:hypothetical protein
MIAWKRLLVLCVAVGGAVLVALYATDQLLLPLVDQTIGPIWKKESNVNLLRRVLITSVSATVVCTAVVQLLLARKVEALSLRLAAAIAASFFASQIYYFQIGRSLDAYIVGGVNPLALSVYVTMSTVVSVILVNTLSRKGSAQSS